jgi:hypothetical protein
VASVKVVAKVVKSIKRATNLKNVLRISVKYPHRDQPWASVFVSVRLPVFAARSLWRWLRNRRHEASMLHALQANQASRELLNLSRLPVNDKDLKARIMVQVRMTG